MLDEVLYCSHKYQFIIETIFYHYLFNLALVSNLFLIYIAFKCGLQAIELQIRHGNKKINNCIILRKR